MSELTDWLLEGPAWVQYRTRVDLLKQKEDHPDVRAARKAMLADPQIKATIRAAGELSTTGDGKKPVIVKHKGHEEPTFLRALRLLGSHAYSG